MKSNALNLDGVKFQVKTTYAGRRSETPLLTISKAGYTLLNTAFMKTYGKKKTKAFVQVVFIKNKYYLLLSLTKKQHYYCLFKSGDAKSNHVQGKIQGFITLFGKKNLAMRYELIPTPTTQSDIQAFEIKHVAEDLFSTKESNNFETV